MSHTHFLFHIVFATKDRMPLISARWESELHAYLSGIIKNIGGHALEINGIEDHVHVIAQLDLKMSFPDTMRELKASSSRWIRQYHDPKFHWQRRYGAFTVSESALGSVRSYVRRQKEHHSKQGFEEEYKILLEKHRVAFTDGYLWSQRSRVFHTLRRILPLKYRFRKAAPVATCIAACFTRFGGFCH